MARRVNLDERFIARVILIETWTEWFIALHHSSETEPNMNYSWVSNFLNQNAIIQVIEENMNNPHFEYV